MPSKYAEDYKRTRSYIPRISHEYSHNHPLKQIFKNLEKRLIHEGRVVYDDFTNLNYVRSLFGLIDFECLIDINEQICPRFILEFYSQFRLSYNDDGEIFVEFMFQDQYYSFSLEEFAEILGVPCEGACVFTDKWALYELANGLPGDGPYQTFLPSLDDIITLVRVDREGPVTRVRHKKEIDVIEYQVLTREIDPTFKDIETILRENVFGLGGNRDHVPACLCLMIYCIANSLNFNLAYFMAKRMEWVSRQSNLILPYGMFLTKILTHILNENPELQNPSYVLYDHVMEPLSSSQERKPRRDRGTRKGRTSTSSTPAFGEPSSSHPTNDDEDVDHNEGNKTMSILLPSPVSYVNSLTNQVPQAFKTT
ncbi:hypothetical protein Tco_0223918 [Tanacetum coccineum]